MAIESETMREICTGPDTGGRYTDIVLLRSSSRSRIYSAIRNGKRFLLKTAAEISGKSLLMLQREYELSLTLSHPGLAYVFSYEPDTPAGPCIVMEYVAGRTLDNYLKEHPSLSARRKVFAELLEAVEYIHSRGIVHNDLTPGNIIVTDDGNRCKIIDFGFADNGQHTTAKSLGGTAGYASPELLSGNDVDARSDIWSLGKLLSDIFGSRRFRRISDKCTRKEPCRRYQSVSELRKALLRRQTLPAVSVFAAVLAALCLVGAIQYRSLSGIRQELTVRGDELVRRDSTLDSLSKALETMKRKEKERAEKEEKREAAMNALKGRIDKWYRDNVPAFKRKTKDLSDYEYSLAIGNLNEQYIEFWKKLLYSECPQEMRPVITDYLTEKYNTDYPPVSR